MKLILWWSFASLLQVPGQQSKVCIGIPQQQKTLQIMFLFAACMPGLSGHDRCSFFMFLYDTVSLCYSNSLGRFTRTLLSCSLYLMNDKSYLRVFYTHGQISVICDSSFNSLFPFEVAIVCYSLDNRPTK